MLNVIWAIVDHPWYLTVGLSLVFKLRLDRIYSIGDKAIFIFRHFGLIKITCSRPFFGGGEARGSWEQMSKQCPSLETPQLTWSAFITIKEINNAMKEFRKRLQVCESAKI